MRAFQVTTSITVAICTALWMCQPPHKANPTWIRSATSIMLMHEMKDAQMISNNVAPDPGRRDRAAVTVRLEQYNHTTDYGYSANRDVVYEVTALARSRCGEFIPGCMELEQKNVFQTISIKTDM
jgi:hypothetical protein